ncbi:MAG: hypothetical protein SF182_20600 [Deltaproteobacteria bacterium]|nr:hypothetical protein [Deltaproteobacteria bacterium]
MRDFDLAWPDLLDALRRRRGLVLRIAGAGVGLMLLAAFVLGPTYRASTTLLVAATRSRSISPDAEAMPLVDRVGEEDLNSQAELLRSEPLIRRVLEPQAAAGLAPAHGWVSWLVSLPREAGRALYRALHDVPAPTPLDEWVDDVRDHLDVAVVKKTNLIEVAYKQRGVDPTWMAAFLNDLVDAALRQQASAGQQAQASEFFDGQRGLLAERVQAAEQAKKAFFQREGLDSIPEQRAVLRGRLSELNVGLENASTDLATADARVESLQRELSRHPATIAQEVRRAQNQAVQFLKPRVMEKEMARDELLSTYAPTNSRVVDAERELSAAKRLLAAEQAMVAETTTTANPTHQAIEAALASATVEAAALRARVAALRAQADETRAAIAHLDDVGAENSRLEQELAAANEAYLTYTRKQEQARLGSALDASRIVNVAVVEPAAVPPTPERAHGLILLALGAMMSLGCGLAVALLLELLDPTVRSGRDAERAAGVPVLAEVPS